MSLIRRGVSAFGKLFIVIALAAAFLFGAGGVVYLSLQGEELKVPEIVGKDLVESERELAGLGLRIKKRADRYSNEKPNTVLEQLPKAGDTVKTGQMILVVTSKTNPEGEEAPVTIKKNTSDENDSEKIEELISDKPKKTNKSNANANSNKKKSSTTRDVIGGSNSNDNSNSSDGNNSNAKNSNAGDKSNKNQATNSNKSNTNNAGKSDSNKAATGGDTRPRRTPQP